MHLRLHQIDLCVQTNAFILYAFASKSSGFGHLKKRDLFFNTVMTNANRFVHSNKSI